MRRVCLALALSAALAAPAAASDRFAVTASAGTLGVGGDIQVRVIDYLALRAGGHFFSFDINERYDGVDYDADLQLSNGIFSADAHPFKNGWMISGGVIVGERGLGLDGEVDEPVEIGDLVFTPEQVGTLRGDVDLNSVSPFIGLGFDNAVTKRSGRVGFSALIGAAFTGEPDVELSAEGGVLSDDPVFLAELAEEEENLEDDFDDFPVYPIVRFGVSVSF
ncbi:MAG: hypothetical protein AAF869_02730 [Pseudomonadota bacterium]